MSNKLCISAYNIHQGGGKVVLEAFLKEKNAGNNLITCYVDSRLDINFDEFTNVKFLKIRPSIFDRLKTEIIFKKNSIQFDEFYFLGNLPPLFRLNSNVILFLQNRLLITRPIYINTLSPKTILRSILEFTWFKLFIKNVTSIEVQTPSMKKNFEILYPNKKINIRNYVDFKELIRFREKFESASFSKEENSFVYITSTDSHKNLRRLILAFSKIQHQYTLYLTIKPSSQYFRLANRFNLNLKCIESTEREEILKTIYTSEFLIFPSLIESLGMPLVEASAMGTKILASNKDFVFDVCTPIDTFDPESISSIEQAINKQLSQKTSYSQ